jgi:hypothetical protein
MNGENLLPKQGHQGGLLPPLRGVYLEILDEVYEQRRLADTGVPEKDHLVIHEVPLISLML